MVGTELPSLPARSSHFLRQFRHIGTMIVLNLVIGVIMNSMDDRTPKCPCGAKSLGRKAPTPSGMRFRTSTSFEELSSEMKVIKKMLEENRIERFPWRFLTKPLPFPNNPQSASL